MPLNPSQETAVTGTGFPLILAGPGSGKTRVITEKILHLIDQGVPPNQILALTFTAKAGAEMSDRIEEKQPHHTEVLYISNVDKWHKAYIGNVNDHPFSA
jgi:DNA helicase-2/ATP-dependent DNA helicase PcrA